MDNNNNNNNNIPENQNDVSFETFDNFTVVESNDKAKNNKLPVIIIICVLAVALLAGIALFVAKSIDKNTEPTTTERVTESHSTDTEKIEEFLDEIKQEKITNESGSEISREEYLTLLQQQLVEATTMLQQNVGITSPHIIVEQTTTATSTTAASNSNSNSSAGKPQTTKPQTETTTAKKTNERVDAQIKAFFSRKFYIQGAFYSGNTGDPLYMSMNGDSFEVLTNLEGTELSFLRIGKSMYLKRPAVRQYAELTPSFFDALGMDPALMQFDFGNTTYNDVKDKFTVYDVSINGRPGVCYYYKNSEQAFKFYAADDELKQIEIYNANGTIASQFAIDYFSEAIPGDQLTLKGYEKTGMGTLFADLL
ncbi:MAG: hypothetical protein J6Q94_03850 [Clostridia bacterium]|nr:hypothetical protein [Clostridia bacterium]